MRKLQDMPKPSTRFTSGAQLYKMSQGNSSETAKEAMKRKPYTYQRKGIDYECNR